MPYPDALTELYQAPLATFVAERKRLAGNLKAEGDKAGAAKLLKLPRPTTSAWVVNQLYWHARDAFDALLATAERLRQADLAATAAHRDALATLRTRAQTFLTDAGHAPTEATLRRVTTTLAAVAATGGFTPDEPGTLAEDRDPPGFDIAGLTLAPLRGTPSPEGPGEPGGPPSDPPGSVASPPPRGTPSLQGRGEPGGPPADPEGAVAAPSPSPTRDALRLAEAARLARVAAAEQRERDLATAAERRRDDEARARRRADRVRLDAALRTAEGDVAARERALVTLRDQLAAAERALATARATHADLAARLAALPDDDAP
jgi:hypothetical protein